MSMLIAAAAFVASPRISSSAEGRVSVRVERAVVASAEAWTQAPPEQNRRERIIKDEQGKLRLQRVVDYE